MLLDGGGVDVSLCTIKGIPRNLYGLRYIWETIIVLTLINTVEQ